MVKSKVVGQKGLKFLQVSVYITLVLFYFGLFPMRNAITRYFKDSYQELHKVSWPTKNQAVRISAIVLGFSLVTAAFIGLLDYALTLGVTTFIQSVS